MEVIIKGCTKEKDTRPELLPAIERYIHPDMNLVREYAEAHGSRLLIISGKFGLLEAEELIPYYGYKLSFDEVPAMTERVIARLQELELKSPDNKVIYFLPSDVQEENHPRPYEMVITGACTTLGLEYEIHNSRELYD